MVEQIQVTPPYESLVSSGITAPETQTGSGHTTTPLPTSAGAAGDTVTLSASALANQLYLQGDSVAKISEVLGIPPTTVESDLNITADSTKTATPAVEATTAQTPGQVTPADAGTPAHASASPYTAPSVTTEKIS